MDKLLRDNIELKHRITQIINQAQCRKNFHCLNNSLDNLCKIDYLTFIDFYGDTDIFECLDDIEVECDFRFSLEDRHLCKCPVRIEIMKHSG